MRNSLISIIHTRTKVLVVKLTLAIIICATCTTVYQFTNHTSRQYGSIVNAYSKHIKHLIGINDIIEVNRTLNSLVDEPEIAAVSLACTTCPNDVPLFVQSEEAQTLKILDIEHYSLSSNGLLIKRSYDIGKVVGQNYSMQLYTISSYYGFLMLMLIIAILVFVISFFAIREIRSFARLFKHSIEDITGALNQDSNDDSLKSSSAVYEVDDAIERIHRYQLENDKLKEYEKKQASYTLASQVLHDMRAPLEVMGKVIPAIDLQDHNSQLLKRAVQSIHSIADNLLDVRQKEQLEGACVALALSLAVEQVRSYSSSNLTINASYENTTLQSSRYARITFSDLYRCLTNILKNAKEILEDSKGIIDITVSESNGQIIIKIKDNGCGIPQNKLESIFEPGISFKKSGSGIGLYFVKQAMQKCGGDIQVNSQENAFSEFTIILEAFPTPPWVAKHISLIKIKQIIIIDDDEYSHEMLKNKLSPFKVPTISFYDPKTASKHISSIKKEDLNEYLFLVDHDFPNSTTNGLNIITQHEIHENAILVTNNFDDAKLIERSEQHQVIILPKPLITSIPVIKALDTTIYFLDDDFLNLTIWEQKAIQKGIDLKCYSSYKDLDADKETITHHAPIYIDSSLQNDLKGEDVAKILSQEQYTNLHICSYHKFSDIKKTNNICSAIFKRFPY